MTTVLALGACGGVGRYAVPVLLDDERIGRVVLADLDGERATAQARTYGERVDALQLDVTDTAALRTAIGSVDIVMNTVGPFFRFGEPILRVTLEVGRSYVDVCDDPEPTLEMLGLDALARERGVSAVVGMGITPGVSNLLAVLAIEELEEAREVITGWDVEAALPEEIGREPSAATVHGVEQLTGTIRVRRGGRWVDERPIRPVDVDYPGLGLRKAWTIGHPEPVTLPRAFPSIEESVNVMVTSPGNALAMRALRFVVDAGLLSRRRAAQIAERLEGEGGQTPNLAEVLARASRKGRLGLPPIFALARGVRADRSAAVGVMLLSAPAGGIGGTTGVPLGVAVRMLARGDVARTGVLSPEEALDPSTFLDELAPLCDPPAARAADLLLVSRSWESPNLHQMLRTALR